MHHHAIIMPRNHRTAADESHTECTSIKLHTHKPAHSHTHRLHSAHYICTRPLLVCACVCVCKCSVVQHIRKAMLSSAMPCRLSAAIVSFKRLHTLQTRNICSTMCTLSHVVSVHVVPTSVCNWMRNEGDRERERAQNAQLKCPGEVNIYIAFQGFAQNHAHCSMAV